MWLGYGYFIETIRDGDGTYHLVVRTEDFNTRKEADNAVTFFRKAIKVAKGPNGGMHGQ